MADNIYEISMLLDFYGQLLTDNQQQCMDMHYNQDLSLSEIGEELNISRQGVHDFIRRGRVMLYEYEEKLGLLKKFRDAKAQIESMQNDLSMINKDGLSEIDAHLIDVLEQKLFKVITEL